MMQRKNLLILGSLILVITVSFLLFKNFHSQEKSISTEDRIQEFISSEFSGLNYDNKPIFRLHSLKDSSGGWYLADIRSIHKTKKEIPVYLILLDTNNTLRVILGPDTHFTEKKMLQYNIPDPIMKELL